MQEKVRYAAAQIYLPLVLERYQQKCKVNARQLFMSERERKRNPSRDSKRDAMVKSPIKGIDMQAKSNDGFDTLQSQAAFKNWAIYFVLISASSNDKILLGHFKFSNGSTWVFLI